MNTHNNFNIKLDEVLTNQMTVNKNLSQEIILTTSDKVTIILNEHHQIIKKKSDWLNPMGIFISVFTTLLTAKFEQEVFGISAEMWKSIFILTCLFSFSLGVYYIYEAVRYSKKGSVEDFITKLKNQSDATNHQTTNKRITIHSAKYFFNDSCFDVTQKVISKVNSNDFEMVASNDIWGDPSIGNPKTLEVNYSVNGFKKTLILTEGMIGTLE